MYDVRADHTELLPHDPGLFLAPVWSPEGDRWLAVSASGDIDQLKIFGPGEVGDTQTVASAPRGEIAFSWSPSGQQVAYAVRRSKTDPFYGPIHVFDMRTEVSQRITDRGFRILGFFWSPDGQRIGYLTRQTFFEPIRMQWRVYDFIQETDRGFKAFQPSLQWQFVINSFNQYTQSHRFWSPDGRYLVFADRDQELVERVWLIDTWSMDGSNTILIDEGTLGIWSWN